MSIHFIRTKTAVIALTVALLATVTGCSSERPTPEPTPIVVVEGSVGVGSTPEPIVTVTGQVGIVVDSNPE